MNRRRALIALTMLLAGAAFLSGCSSSSSTRSAKIFQTPPWAGPESYTYQLSRRDEPDAGLCVLETAPNFEPGNTKISRLCGKEPYRDDGTATVDAATLAPVQTVRTFVDGKNNRTNVFTSDYADGQVTFTADLSGKVRRATRDLPKPTKDSPDPGWYDDESLLWLARGITLRSGYTGYYTYVINAGQPRIVGVEVLVEPPEQVTVPAGTFEAWKVRVHKDTSNYYIWVERTSPNRVIQAQIEDITYKLAAAN
ncbi:MAG: hypothetical protein HYX53_06085 [Chloroflexi bacterium]|nr:hypothetical protein [Chloroflexota bacterium]